MPKLVKRIQAIQPFHVMSLLNRSRELEKSGRDIVHMEIGEPDFPSPDQVIRAGIRALEQGSIKYTVAAGLPELRDAISGFYQVRCGVSIPRERIFVTPGGSGGLLLALAMHVCRGDRVLMADPCYPCNRNMISLFEGETVLIPVGAARNYQADLGSIKHYWNDQTRGVLIASPSNPAGSLIDPLEFRSIVEFVESRGGFVLSDEIYHGLHYDQQAITALSFSDQVLVVNSFSKYFGMTGWRLGWLVVPETSIDATEHLMQNLFISAPAHSQIAALAAFDPVNIRELESRRAAFRERRDFIVEQLIDIGFEVPVIPQGAFYVYAGCRPFAADSFEFCNRLLEDHGIAFTPGKDFGDFEPELHVRFAYTTSMERLEEGMRRLRRALPNV